jgi:hypothetical protein
MTKKQMDGVDNEKIAAVKSYQKNCPQKLRDYVVKTLGYKRCNDWPFEMLADEFGYGYIRYWNMELEKVLSNIKEAQNGV